MNDTKKSNVLFWGAVIAVILILALLGGIVFWNRMQRDFTASSESANAAALKAFYEAQQIYRRTDYDGDGVLEYAQRMAGNHSLLERVAGSGDLALIDRSFAQAEGDLETGALPKAGYVFKILTAQGPHAVGGAKSYLDEKGNMTLGFAAVAQPGAYDQTGRITCIINQDGTIFEADLGPDTAKIVRAMTEFNPEPGKWVPTE